MARLVLAAVLSVVATLGATPQAAAQIDQIDEVTEALQETADQIGEAAGQTVGGSGETVKSAGEDVDDAVGGASGGLSEAVQETATNFTGEGGSVPDTVSDAGGDAGATSGGSVRKSNQSSRGTLDQSRGRDASGSRIKSAPTTAPGSARRARVLGASGEGWSGAIYVPLLIHLSNDADGDGSYSDAETARRQDEDVQFQVRLENVGSNELAVLAVRDVSPTPTGVEEDAACRDLAGIRLAPGESTTCRFTVRGLTPPAGERVVRLFEVDAVDTTDPSRTGTVVDTTVIRTGGTVLGEFIRRGLGALATTGVGIIALLAAAAVLAGIGGPFVLLGNRRRRPLDQASLSGTVGNHSPRSRAPIRGAWVTGSEGPKSGTASAGTASAGTSVGWKRGGAYPRTPEPIRTFSDTSGIHRRRPGPSVAVYSAPI